MDSLYPAGPSAVPAQLTAPSSAYRRHAWLAVAGLLTFAAAYFALMGWFGWTAFRMLRMMLSGEGGNALLNAIVGGFALFLAVFMAKGLIFLKRGKASEDLELKPADQPELFAFLHRLADEAGAPRPKRVYLSPRVNAGVFYDLSLVNLLFPSRKNLDIGLALVNALNLTEFKAVLGHEFGHFAQRTMAVGRWVYVAHQIATQLVARRDALDTFLAGLSRTDFRVAWVGWTLSLIIWAIRSLVDTAFSVVSLSERALSREMEYQADLVAASLAGSDALVHALHKLGAADVAWDKALDFASRQYAAGHPVADLFAVQTRMLANLRRVSPDPMFADPPQLPEHERELHRVFRSDGVRVPQMWSTHPANADRENNLKRRYVAAVIDERPAMLLFRDADGLKQKITRDMLREAPPAFADAAETLSRLDAEFEVRAMQQRYQGSYLRGSFLRSVATPGELFVGTLASLDNDQLRERIAALYSPAHGQALQQLQRLEAERATLEGARTGYLRASASRVHWRDQVLGTKQLASAIATVDAEIAPLRQAVFQHDQECRSLHRLAARRTGEGWEQLLEGQVSLLHFCEHVEADLRDLYGVFLNTMHVVTADNRVSEKELRRLIAAANQMQRALVVIYDYGRVCVVDQTVIDHGGKPLRDALGELGMGLASEQNINNWIQHAGGWVNHTCAVLSQLRAATLEALLANEDAVEARLASGEVAPAAPGPSQVPREYPVLLPGKERKLQTKLGPWDRFQTANGWGASLARGAVAAGIVVGVLALGMHTGAATVSLYNGLAIPVRVTIDGSSVSLDPLQSASMFVDPGTSHKVQAHTADGLLIESFDSEHISGRSHFTYNVAGAAPLMEWSAVYGDVKEEPERYLGAERWMATRADYVLESPPDSIQTGKYEQGGRRSVVSAKGDLAPQQQATMVDSDEQREAMILAHARWDAPESRNLPMWMAMAMTYPQAAKDVVADRLARYPEDVATLRMEQDVSEGAAHDATCERQRQIAAQKPTSSAFAYLVARCMDDGPAKNDAFLAGYRRWPQEPWFAMAAGFTLSERRDWAAANQALTTSTNAPQTADISVVELARVKRMLGASPQEIESLASDSAFLSTMLAFESEQVVGTPYEAYLRLDEGDYERALSLAQANPALYPRIVRLVAASDGASAEWIEQALGLPVEENVDLESTWSMWALTLRHGGNEAAWRQKVLAIDPEEAQRVVAFVDAVRANASTAQAEAALGDVRAGSRGNAYTVAAILRGESCPPQWRDGAKKLLFGSERPHLL
ncbi:M48 family metallopeptidase [Stenotrophomonas sp.]|uniref:M48 family metallopeptidase n=1 Tax=Stenotrophomonas sp. TaxID=69392 RepID=UPI00289F8485|nr:M48 family metallopeptidase [Stenotrophomonas sp.]